jgi:Zn-finger protein
MSESIVEMWLEEMRTAARAAQGIGPEAAEPVQVIRRPILRQRRDTEPAPRVSHPETEPTQRTERLYRLLCRDAGIRGLLVTLTNRQYAYLALGNECHYCGCPLRGMGANVDRKDPTGNYTPGNSVACCRDCNKAKLSHSYETWKAIADAFIEKHGRGTMWPDEDAKDSEANKARVRLGREASAVASGIRALALWAIRHAESEKQKQYRAEYRERYRRRQEVAAGVVTELEPEPIASVSLIKPIRKPTPALPSLPRPRGGFIWRGRWRPSR